MEFNFIERGKASNANAVVEKGGREEEEETELRAVTAVTYT